MAVLQPHPSPRAASASGGPPGLPPSRAHRLPKVLSLEEYRRLVAALPDPESRVLVTVLFGAGVRTCELLGQPERVTEVRGRVYYQEARSALAVEAWDARRGLLRVVGKGNRERVVPVAPGAARVLEAWARGRDGPSLFPLYAWRSRALRRALADASARAGIRHVSPHQGRHSCAVWLLRGGLDVRDVQAVLGHANLQTSMVYLSVAPDEVAARARAAHPLV